jgi:outer membrane protein OmpA-like peptidoglycan-associated protein
MLKRLAAALVLCGLGAAYADEPSAPAAAEAVAKEPREFAIFFEHGGPWIPEAAQAVIPQVAEIFLRIGYSAVSVGCYSDNVGSQDLNLALTKDRAKRIKTELVRYKVPESAIVAEGFGFADPLIEGMPLDTAVSNRRCVIKLT